MPQFSSTFCLKCGKIYDDEKRKMCTGACNHSICEQCFNKKLSSICPVCEKVNAFEEKKINWQAIEMVKTLKHTSSISKIFDMKFDPKTLTQGACSECKKHSDKLRICTDCSKKTNLLMHRDDGTVELTTETSDELLETKILRIKSTAICADCALDGIHKGHHAIAIKDIRKLEETSEVLNIFTFLALSIHNITDEDSVHYKDELRYFNFLNQMFEVLQSLYKYGEKVIDKNDEIEQECFFLLKLAFGAVPPVFSTISELLAETLKISSGKVETTESSDEKREWQKTAQKVKKVHDSLTSGLPQFEITENDVVRLYNMYKDGTLGKLFSGDTETFGLKEASEMKKTMREMYYMTKDVRRTFKIPPKYEKYANFAGSCIQFLLGEDKRFEVLELD